ncbi:ATPase [Lachnospiraceae bacterium KK002]
MSNKIEQIIDEIEDYIENCKYQPFSNSRIVVDKDEIEDLLSELRRRMPDEIKRYQRMISNKEAILADAQAKADAIIAQAEVHTTELVSEHEIMQQAYAQANEVVLIATNQAQEILDNATNDANNIRMGAIQYTDDILKGLESIIGHAMDTTKARTDNLLNSLQECYSVVNANRIELSPAGGDPDSGANESEAVPELQVTEI